MPTQAAPRPRRARPRGRAHGAVLTEAATLYDWYAKGHQFEKCLASMGSGATITIDDALLASIQGQDQLTLGFDGPIEFKSGK